MKIVASSDWRDSIPFESPVVAAEVVPGESTRCVACGPDSAPRERTELWAYKHRHPKQHGGYVRFYCAVHVPAAAPAPAPAVAAPRRASRAAPPSRAERLPAARRPSMDRDHTRAMCPNCFVEVSATGECGMCGWSGD